jgi:crotonobetainyl-CoA:carnitine CoA-transferase CaiB-like acyl-CoA transferase
MSEITRVGPLDGTVILDATVTEAGRFCATLLADLGATVLREDRPEAGADNAHDPYLAQVLLRNRSFPQERAAALLARSQVLIVDEKSEGWEEDACKKSQPSLIFCRISPFGTDSPWADRDGDDLVVQAHSSFMELTGEPGRPPIRMGARVLPLMAGAIAAVEIIGCLLDDARLKGSSIDVSVLDTALNTLTYMAPMYLTFGQIPERVGSGHTTIYPYNAFEVADGHIVAAPFTGRFWRNFCQALGAPEWGTDPRFKDFQNRLDNRKILEPMLNERMKDRTRAEWLEVLEEADVPCGPVNLVSEALTMDVSQARELIVDIAQPTGAPVRALGLPIKIQNGDGTFYRPEYRQVRDVPASAAGTSPSGHPSAAVAAESTRPLEGVRVIDLTRMAAGPYCTQMLVDLGAEVIKIEEPGIGDPTRRNVPYIGEVSSYFYAFNRGKKSIALDMKTPEGKDVVRKLLETADVVIENFRPGVTERLGLDYATVSRRNKRLVYASISGFGQTGPMREKISFDLVNQAVAGMLAITSEPGCPPARIGMAVGDLGGGLFACLGVMAALKQRDRTGEGAHVDISLHDVLVTLLGGVAQDYLSTGVEPGPRGSEHPHHVPERAFATADAWLVLEAWTDKGWKALTGLAEFSKLAEDRFATLDQRLDHRDAIHAAIAEILAGQSSAHWMTRLQLPGIGVAPVANIAAALDSDYVAARDLIVENALPQNMTGRTIGSAFRLNGQHVGTAAPPPRLGEHNAEQPDVSAAA